MQISKAKIKAWSMLGQRGSIFGVGLKDIASIKDNLKVLSADLSLLSGMDGFIKKYPDKFLQVGIAEQNMIGIAAGLATEGNLVVASTYASFIAVRSLEHVRQNVAYPKANVKIIGSSAGVIAAKSGVSHWATEDLAFMRVLPNMTVLSPCDAIDALKCLDYAVSVETPVYIRLSGGLNCPVVYEDDYNFEVGRPYLLKEGRDIAILATGLMVRETLDAALLLEDQGISVAVYNVHTIKPLNKADFNEIFDKYKVIATVEEHNILGGLGSAVAELKAVRDKSPRQIFIGFQDCYTKAGSQRYIWDLAGLTKEKIQEKILIELKGANHD